MQGGDLQNGAVAAPPEAAGGAVVAPPAGDAGAADHAVPGAIEPLEPAPSARKPTLTERIEKTLENLVVLRVTTVVGTVTATGADAFDQVTGLTLAPDGQQVSCTSINMVLGDCSLILTPSFVDNPAYKQLHDDAVKQALAVRQQTMDLLKQAVESFKDMFFH